MTIDRRFFLKTVGAIGLSTTFKAASANTSIQQNTNFAFACPPYLQNFTNQHVTICSIFNKPCIAWVELIDASGQVSQVIYQTEDGMRNVNTDFFKFKIPHQQKNFTYRIVSKEISRFEPYKIEYGQEIHSDTIPTKLPFSNTDVHVLILNDIHEDTKSYRLLSDKSSLPRKDAVFLNGDCFHYVSSPQDLITKLFQPLADIAASKTPFVMIRGNHETRGSFARDYKKYFDYPENKFYQAFTLGSIFWVLLDGGEDKPDNHEVYAGTVDYDSYRLEQKAWLAEVLSSKERKRAKHTIVVNHIPFFHSDDWHGTLHNRACFHDIMQKHKVDALISGHTHKYGFYPPDSDHNYHVLIGGGPKAGSRTLIEVSALGSKLDVKLKKETGELINSFSKT